MIIDYSSKDNKFIKRSSCDDIISFKMGQILLMKIFSNFKRCCFLSIFKIIQKKLQDRFSAAQPLWGGRRGRVSKPLATNLCHLITSFIIFRFSFGFISSKTRRRAKSGGRARACLVKFSENSVNFWQILRNFGKNSKKFSNF